MGRAEVLQGARPMRFENLLDPHEREELSQIEAAEMLGVSERTLRHWRIGCARRGRRVCWMGGSASRRARRAAVAEIPQMLGLYEEHYEGCTAKHFHEPLVKPHDDKFGNTVTRLSPPSGGR